MVTAPGSTVKPGAPDHRAGHSALSVRHVRNSLKVAASSLTRRVVCLTPPVDNVLISTDWVILSG
jgi:hypothetical protein